MEKDYFIKLTLAVYKVTELFPGNESLKYDIRNLANEILVNLILPLDYETQPRCEVGSRNSQQDKALSSIETLNGCFDLAETKNWVDSRNFLVLRREYSKIVENLKKDIESRAPQVPAEGILEAVPRVGYGPVYENVIPAGNNQRFNNNGAKDRQKRILEVFKGNGRVKVGDLIKIFPEVNRRTLLRDLENFSRTGVVEKNGNGRGAYYIPRNATL